MRKRNPHHFAVMGPWAHGVNVTKVGEIDFGQVAQIDIGALKCGMLDHFLKDTPLPAMPPLRLFIMGRNQWRDEQEWPLARAVATKWYLHSDGNAASAAGNGRLTARLPEVEPVDRFVYDPLNPVPTCGGRNLGGAWGVGPMNQATLEARTDVLVYSSEPLPADLEVTGPVVLVLYAASSARDTDFTGKLVDVWPDGKVYNLCDSIIRARFREGSTAPSLIEPRKVYRYEFCLGVISNVYLQGHRIRVEVASSNFPRFARNLNTGGPLAQEVTPVTAEQEIHHSAEFASHLLLPVVP
jgi:putative CocE/NonD family hydrolase